MKPNQKNEPGDSDPIFADPAFREAMEDVKARLRTGNIKWHSYDEVFGKRKKPEPETSEGA